MNELWNPTLQTRKDVTICIKKKRVLENLEDNPKNVNKKEYMRQYMHKRRIIKAIRKQENKKAAECMRRIRSTSEGKRKNIRKGC